MSTSSHECRAKKALFCRAPHDVMPRAFVNGAAGGAKKNREKSRSPPACDVRVPGARLPGRDDVCARCVSGYEDHGDMCGPHSWTMGEERAGDRNLPLGIQADLHVGLACVPPRVNPSHYPPTIVLYTGVFRHHPLTRSHRVLRLRSGERMNKVSGAGMGGNGPQHTLVMRGASPAKRPSRASLEAHHSQARRSLRTSIAPANFFSRLRRQSRKD